MRIVGGYLSGRRLDWPKTKQVRPMSELVREALFNILGSIEDYNVLDAYAGSGSVGFEALSRGAASVEAVEMLALANRSIRSNSANLAVENQYRLHATDIQLWLRRTPTSRFDLIVAGPPFAALNTEVLNQLGQMLKAGPKSGRRVTGTLVTWHSSRITPPELKSVKLTQSRKYGDSSLSFYSSQDS